MYFVIVTNFSKVYKIIAFYVKYNWIVLEENLAFFGRHVSWQIESYANVRGIRHYWMLCS